MISLDFKVVGVTFVDAYPKNIELIYRVMQLRAEAAKGGTGSRDALRGGGTGSAPDPVRVDLVRNPDNEHDPNAVEIHVRGVGMIGHAPRGVAADLAPCLDSEPDRWSGYVDHVLIHQNDRDLIKQPGIQVHVYEMRLPDGSSFGGLASRPTEAELRAASARHNMDFTPKFGRSRS